jgi:undecaprenyl-diphosphatase
VTATLPPEVVVEEPDRRANLRHPSDVLRLIIALVVTVIGFLLATTLNELSEAITVEVVEGFDGLANAVVVVFILGMSVLSLFIPLLAIGSMIWRRQWRRLVLALLASVVAIALLGVIEFELVDRFSPPDVPFEPPSWVCESDATEVGLSCVPGGHGGLGELAFVTGFVAFFSALAPWLTRRWRLAAWILIGLYVVVRMISAFTPPVDEFLAIGLAYAVGAAVLVVFGEPDRRPQGGDVVSALARSGIELSELRRAGVDARGSTPYFAKTATGEGLFVKVLTPEERAADILFRILRMFRLKGMGDERPFSSLKRAVEHEAVASLMASSDGVRTPQIEAVAEVPPNSMVMAYALVEGTSLDSVPPEELTDELLQGVWGQVATLRRHRTAHRDLRLANVFRDSENVPWMIDFGFAELAATDGQLRSDVAELVTSTATMVGAERAVGNAVAGVGPDAVADAAPRIQPIALSGATREALKQQKGLDEEIRGEIQQQTGVDEVELEDLERVKTRTVLMVIGFTLAIYFLIPQLAQTDFGAVLDANWAWAPAILLASFLTYVGAAWNVMGSVPDSVRLVPSVLAQFAGTFINRITPVKVGGMATNVRYLQKSGVDTAVAVSGIGISSVATFVVHMTLLILTAVFVGRNAGDFIELPSGTAVLVGLVVVFTLAGLVVFLPFGRKIFAAQVWPVLKRSGQGLVQIAQSPLNALMLFGGAFIMIMAYITALWFSLEAFGGGLGFFAVALVFLAGQALGQVAPTPGGIGATEAAMIAAMTALGLPAETAVPTVFLYRIATFWLPILPGLFSLRKLEADGVL